GIERLLIPGAHFVAISGLAFTLIVLVVIRSPYTHGNFKSEGYSRTDIAHLGVEHPFPGFPLTDADAANTGDSALDGGVLFFSSGCAACHGLQGQGGSVGPELESDISASKVRREVRDGPKGMPAFAEDQVSDETLDKIVAFLRQRTESPRPSPTAAPNPTPTRAPAPTPTKSAAAGETPTTVPAGTGTSLTAVNAAPVIDGDNSDWADVPGLAIVLKQFEIPAASDWEFNGEVEPKNATLKVATDDSNIYVLVEVEDSYDYVAEDHGLSPAFAVMFQIEDPAGPHMGSGPDDLEEGLGMVDIWHWELDCGPGVLSGGGDPGDGDDPDCNLDDEYATDPESRDDDDQSGAENSIAGAWSHAPATLGADGTWIFEMSRPLQTGDTTDAQFAPGGIAHMAIAYWDPKESAAGWSNEGHLTSADLGWLEVTIP
ncbi:MAG: ethylbenzene dehydrogenase-related protein, partial [Dehalococcoidia bacterium]